MNKFVDLVETTVDLEKIESDREFRVRADVDPNLADLADRLKRVEREMGEELLVVAHKLNLEPKKTVKLEIVGPHGPCFRVTMKEEKALRGVKGISVLDTVKAGVRFTNKHLGELASEHGELNQEYQSTSAEIVEHILKVAGGYTEALGQLSSALAVVDVVCGLAEAANSAYPPWVRPTLLPMGQGRLEFRGLRHPVVECEDDASFIPNDVLLDRDSSSLIVVTGPNAGGKSTYLRSVGVAVVMAQLGSFVPAEEATLSLCDGVYTRIGASDDETRGISTFMAEMLETSIIVEGATENSLVIVDELGRGTSTWDGLGLAWAIAEHLLLKNRSLSLFATHLHQLTRLAGKHANVRNLHATFHLRDQELTLLYKLAEGPCDESFGLSVAEMLKFPPDVLEHARRGMRQEDENQEKMDIDALRRLVVEGKTDQVRAMLSSA